MREVGRTIGIDVGEVRIGVAVSDPLGLIAFPHSVIKATSPKADAEAIQAVVRETEAVRIVAGVPLGREGKPGPQAEKVLAFLDVLRQATPVEVVTQDERYSTAAAQRVLLDADVSRKGRKKVIDKIAAQFILQTYLDRQAHSEADASR